MKHKKPRYSLVDCDWCSTGLVEQCEKCGGSGSIPVVERKTW
jgi:hypothetical protein